jgi:signal transduction histidine kinase
MLTNEDYLQIFHEIKNSITLINSSLQLVAKKHPEVRDFDYWNESIAEIDFLKNMVSELSSARMCEHLNLMQCNLYALMHQIANSVRSLSPDDFTCTLALEDDLPLVDLDPQLFRQAILNLVKNACEAMDGHGVCIVEVSKRDDFIRIAISDQGGGIDPALIPHIFDPFTTTKSGGSGLGLVITRQIAESHGGTITCDSRPGDGCTFTIRIPYLPDSPSTLQN